METTIPPCRPRSIPAILLPALLYQPNLTTPSEVFEASLQYRLINRRRTARKLFTADSQAAVNPPSQHMIRRDLAHRHDLHGSTEPLHTHTTMVTRGRHPKGPVNAALRIAKDCGVELEEVHRGHRWGVLHCNVCGARLAIWSTPRVPDAHGRDIIRFAEKHRHGQRVVR